MKNPLKAKLKAGKTSIGFWISIAHPDVAEIAAKMGFDWVIYDTEHSPYDIETAQKLMQAASYNPDFIPLIRVAWNDMVMIKKALDTGPYGLLVPWVSTREEAEYAVRACMYPPKGVRGCGPRRAALHDPDYVSTANDELLIGVQIETNTAIDNLDDIFSVEGIDYCLVGPGDLSFSLGVHFQYEHPKMLEAMDKVLAACERHDIVPGLYCDTETINGALERGFRFCNLSSDMGLFMKGIEDAFNVIKGWKPTPYKG